MGRFKHLVCWHDNILGVFGVSDGVSQSRTEAGGWSGEFQFDRRPPFGRSLDQCIRQPYEDRRLLMLQRLTRRAASAI
jgi:hypothetical protein